MASQSSSDVGSGPPKPQRLRQRKPICSSPRGRWIRGGLLTGLLVALAGCATVRPEEKEYLAEPAMTFGAHGASQGQEEHVINNREGSFGAGGVSGGGCGCN